MEFLNPGLTERVAPLGPLLHLVERPPVVAHLLFGLAALAIRGGNRHPHRLVIERIPLDARAAARAALVGRVAQAQAFICRQR
jgi:hypothetical protein